MGGDGLIEVMKQIVMDTLQAEMPTDICFGVVTGISPLKISLERKMEITEEFLTVCQQITDHQNDVMLWREGGEKYGYHACYFQGLRLGEKVVLAKMAGGQQYLVLDRVGGEI